MNIIFDFGNVLFDLDLPAFEREMTLLCPGNYAKANAQLLRENVFELYETGGLSSAEFLAKISEATGVPAPAVEAAWNSIFIGMPAHRFDMLLRLREEHKVFLLSNINEIHAQWISAYMLREHGYTDYETPHFDGVYFSHLIRLRKPTRESFEYVLADAELRPEDSVFLDDLPENAAAASALGIQGHWHEPGTEIQEHLIRLGFLKYDTII